MTLTYNRQKTDERWQALERYLSANVLGTDFVCRHYRDCRASHRDTFYEGQLHHVGRFYDLRLDGVPFRVVIVGQEYGHPPARVSCQARYDMVMSSAFGCRFRAGGGYEARNPHMRGTTSVLRLLFGLPLSTEHNSEFLVIDGERHHLFDSFALVNYLLCSAIPANGRMQGLATPTMKKNCGEHFREAICILEPLVIVVQGKTFWPWVRSAFDDVRHEEHEVYTARVASMQSFIAAFTHPSAPFPHNWGTNDQTPYLLQTVAPSIAWIRHQLLAEQGGRAKI